MKRHTTLVWAGLMAFGAGCGAEDPGKATGIASVSVDQTPARLQITGYDAEGAPIALADIQSGSYISTFDELAGQAVVGRQVKITYKDQEFSIDTVDLGGAVTDVHIMPLPGLETGLDGFIRDPRVEPVLGANAIFPSPPEVVAAYVQEHGVRAQTQAPAPGAGEVAYDTYYQGDSSTDGYIEDLSTGTGYNVAAEYCTSSSCPWIGSACSGQTFLSAAQIWDNDSRWGSPGYGYIIEQSCSVSNASKTCNGTSGQQCQASRKECPGSGGQAVDSWCTNVGQNCWPCGVAINGSSTNAQSTSTWVESTYGWIITEWDY